MKNLTLFEKEKSNYSAIQLRGYQNDSIQAVFDARDKENITRPIISLPTGTGKTVIFAELARQLQAKTLILAHRDELIRQAADKVAMIWPSAAIGIVKAEENDYQDRDVVCASVQTLAREKRLNQIKNEDFNFLVIDEAHHTCANTYQYIVKNLGFMDDDMKRLLLGVSATCFRADKKGLGHTFQKVVYEVTILTMIKAGYLSDIKSFRVAGEADISGVETNHGDFTEYQLANAINTDKRNQIIVNAYLENAKDRKALAFCASVQHAKDLADRFNDNGIVAKTLSGDSSDDERKNGLKAFSQGEIKILTNCALFTEGYDEPSIDCILMCRPTKSKILYTQCIGRGTRKYPLKENCIVVDFTDNNHDVCGLANLFGFKSLEKGQSVKEEAEKQGRKQKEQEEEQERHEKKIIEIKKIRAEEFDLLGKSVFRWFFDGIKWRLPVAPGQYAILKPVDDKFQILLYVKDQEARPLHPTLLDFGYAQGISEDYARRIGRSFSRKDAPWREQPASDKQKDLLKKLGIRTDRVSKGMAADLIDEFFAKKEARREQRINVFSSF